MQKGFILQRFKDNVLKVIARDLRVANANTAGCVCIGSKRQTPDCTFFEGHFAKVNTFPLDDFDSGGKKNQKEIVREKQNRHLCELLKYFSDEIKNKPAQGRWGWIDSSVHQTGTVFFFHTDSDQLTVAAPPWNLFYAR